MSKKTNKNIAIYQSKDGAIKLRADSEKETVW
ncbi:MAG: hypothetical protein US81_C0023G0012, partial [Parcubacteria group bacterium GW2011_GWE2_38_18]